MKEVLIGISLVLIGCSSYRPTQDNQKLSIAFGSCNHQNKPNHLWQSVLDSEAEVWIWGGDNIYADTEDIQKMQADYQSLKQDSMYQNLNRQMQVLGVWDDHDYGKNDAGEEYPQKKEAQQLFLDFLEVSAEDPRRTQAGTYYKHKIHKANYNVDILLLDTRYFRTALTDAPKSSEKRYLPNPPGEGTILGTDQWKWLEQNLSQSNADLIILVSSIQVLSQEHGFETWGNFPQERERLFQQIAKSNKPVLILSGDRHISEISEINLPNSNYPLLDFTSSGMTHAYRNFSGELNTLRSGKVISTESFGLLDIDFKHQKVRMQMLGENAYVLQEKIFSYARK